MARVRRPVAALCACAVPLSGGAAAPLTAVCIVGGVRTLIEPLVYRSIATNAIAPLAPARVFATFKLYERIRGGHAGWCGEGAPGGKRRAQRACWSVELLRPALRCIRPNAVRFVRTEEDEGYLLRPQCRIPGYFNASLRMLQRYTGQMKSLYSCVQHVLDHEHRTGETFAAVLKLRPDVVFFRPVQPLQTLLHAANGGVLWSGNPNSKMSDWVFFVPRHRLPFLGAWWDEYLKCDGDWQFGDIPERALYALGKHYNITQAEMRWAVMLRRVRKDPVDQYKQCMRPGLKAVFSNVSECRKQAFVNVSGSRIGPAVPTVPQVSTGEAGRRGVSQQAA
eukprot:TRINITY_DN34970_c0_g1_i3.p1 TRINITY_DN34970_c0_g1~~TRINITY_DN34970_c0_g1_i3.p1  ORF type:complete len:360 (+),score=58.15 TRINITY_DN34970_c0_g1_i3:74-1081(+)